MIRLDDAAMSRTRDAMPQRIWCLLGQDAYLAVLQRDTLRCIELTLMIALIELSF
ncbi:MAG: hypothetical protein HGA45_18300 [Chloroflexales bacterium]|nr:hypothetical protein [Chloroflexales bacterium]